MPEVKQVKSEKVLTPTEEIVHDRNRLYEVAYTDRNGDSHIVSLKEPKVSDQYKLVVSLGNDAQNAVLSNMMQPLLWVKSIDDIPRSMPKNLNEAYALIDSLDNEGLIAINEKIAEIAGGNNDQVEGEKEIAKK